MKNSNLAETQVGLKTHNFDIAMTTDFNEDASESSDKGSAGHIITEHRGRDTVLRMNTKTRPESARRVLGNLPTRRH